MRGNDKKKLYISITLVVLIVLISVGFAAFNGALNISSQATVNPNSNSFIIKFSKTNDRLNEEDVIPTRTSDSFTANNGEIDNSNIPTISNLGGEFNLPGQKITYDFYVLNVGNIDAYLTDVIFKNVDGENVSKLCTPENENDEVDLTDACNAIKIKITIGNEVINGTSSLNNHLLVKQSNEAVKVEISYSENAEMPDVPFNVEIGDIELRYNSLDTAELAMEPSVPDESCFVSFYPGELSYYRNSPECPKNVIIPSDLTLPVSDITGASFNNNRCEDFNEFITLNSSGMNVNCEQIAADVEEMTGEGFSKLKQYFNVYDESNELFEGTFANENYTEGLKEEFKYLITSDLVSISLVEPEISTNNTVEYPITKIGSNAFGYREIVGVQIPNTITDIGWDAFAVNNLESVELPNSLSKVNAGIFIFNIDLEEVILPNTITSIDAAAFLKTNLGSITLPNSVVRLGGMAFAYSGLSEINFGSGLKYIWNAAFYGNDISSITLPNSVEIIEANSFYGNDLTGVTIPSNVTIIGNHAFEDNNLTSVNLTNATSLTTIGERAFQNNSIESVTFPANLTTISYAAFRNNLITSINIPNSVTSLGNESFSKNRLTSVTIGTGLTTIEDYSFAYNNLTSIVIPNNITNIDFDAFSYNNLTSVEIGTGITTIGDSAFGRTTYTDPDTNVTYGPNALTSVTIHVPSSNNLSVYERFGWANGYSNSNICWSDSNC